MTVKPHPKIVWKQANTKNLKSLEEKKEDSLTHIFIASKLSMSPDTVSKIIRKYLKLKKCLNLKFIRLNSFDIAETETNSRKLYGKNLAAEKWKFE